MEQLLCVQHRFGVSKIWLNFFWTTRLMSMLQAKVIHCLEPSLLFVLGRFLNPDCDLWISLRPQRCSNLFLIAWDPLWNQQKQQKQQKHPISIFLHNCTFNLIYVSILKGTLWTALHAATFQEHARVVRILFEYGADPLLQDHMERTPIDLASISEFIWPFFSGEVFVIWEVTALFCRDRE